MWISLCKYWESGPKEKKIIISEVNLNTWNLDLISYIGDPFIYKSHGSVCNKMLSNSSLYLLTLSYHFQNKLSNFCSTPNKFSQNKSKMFYFLNDEIHNFSNQRWEETKCRLQIDFPGGKSKQIYILSERLVMPLRKLIINSILSKNR